MYSENSNKKILFIIVDYLVIFFSIYFFSMINNSKYTILEVLLITLLSVIIGVFLNLYSNVNYRTTTEDFPYLLNLTFVVILCNIISSHLIVKNDLINLHMEEEKIIILFFLLVIGRLLVRKIKINNFVNNKILVLTNFENNEIESNLRSKGYDLVAFISNSDNFNTNYPTLKNSNEIKNLLSRQEVNLIYVTNDARKTFLEDKEFFVSLGLPIIVNLDIQDMNPLSKVELVRNNSNISVIYSMNHTHYRTLVFKRIIDIVFSLVGLLITLIVSMVIYPIINKQSKGPLYFKQKRVGKNGKVFEIYKFRSMYMGAEERKKELMDTNTVNSVHMFKLDNDPRIFPFGQKIRNWSLDELPQFLNVLKGNMSLVGTRPPTLDEYEKYELHHFKRLNMKPGITGMWQVSGRSNITNFEEVVRLDIKYIREWSLLLDFKIILKTILVVLKRNGAK